MSSSIVIPTPASLTAEFDRCHHQSPKAEAGTSSSSSSSYSPSPRNTPELSTKTPRQTEKQKMVHNRRPSLLSSALAKEEYKTINIASDPDGPPRLISYLASSQGFAWNPELFLPYNIVDYEPLEHRTEQVVDICVSDEDIKKIMPQ